MEDAQFFNNQLRMMEISNILPVIASANQQAAERSRTRFLWGFIGVSVALVIIIILSLVNNRQKNRLKKNKAEIEEQNRKQKEMNTQLTELNQLLIETNIKRETYMRLFMDISAAYISKLSDYRKLVTDSQEIATLLHYSTQTIYNYKSGMRAKAINRDSFESDINQLCHIINNS